MFEGKPMVPDAGIVWKLTEKYKVKSIFTSPTAMRLLKKLDYDGKYFKQYDTSSLKVMSLAGEKSDTATVQWIH